MYSIPYYLTKICISFHISIEFCGFRYIFSTPRAAPVAIDIQSRRDCGKKILIVLLPFPFIACKINGHFVTQHDLCIFYAEGIIGCKK